MAGSVDWVQIKNRATRHALFYLNEYFGQVPRLRIEEKRGGARCLWRARTSMTRMKETKRFLEQTWKLDI